jgi:2,5-diamino-6-(ribosylamino)-4(3H)-pyrimidinone 5'-phosphate reductase
VPERREKCQGDKVEALSTHLREREERIQLILERLKQESSKGTAIIVEGKKDVESLRQLGIEGPIISAKTGGKSRTDLICNLEESHAKEVILLFDFDRRGKEWTGTLKRRLESGRVKADLTFWRELLRFAGRELKDVEGLTAYLQTLKEKLGEG